MNATHNYVELLAVFATGGFFGVMGALLFGDLPTRREHRNRVAHGDRR